MRCSPTHEDKLQLLSRKVHLPVRHSSNLLTEGVILKAKIGELVLSGCCLMRRKCTSFNIFLALFHHAPPSRTSKHSLKFVTPILLFSWLCMHMDAYRSRLCSTDLHKTSLYCSVRNSKASSLDYLSNSANI